ncbi:MAG TPA: hypothetical protein VEK57_11525 [Thermoanaerobaculia bacterium]|nr:hypothetical protein [Thermoanaerobaculia bacterium]
MKLKQFLLIPALVVTFFFSACRTVQPLPQVELREEGEEAVAGQMVLIVDNLPNLVFDGKVRASAKTTMVTTAVPVSYTSITAVTTLPIPPGLNNVAPRTGVENNRASFGAYMYAYNLPNDNDFHVILGDTPVFMAGVTNLINVEVSGLPGPGNAPFTAVRNAFLQLVGNPLQLPRSTYTCLPVPIAVTVTGGPFWDTQHPGGNSGTTTCYGGANLKTTNGWELHPVTAIQ